ncbi:MAG: branched-chain amino acid ABC transporter permease LivH [Alphaproteobacteria bacterium]
MDFAYFLQLLINGLTLGAIYGLIAIGYTMVYGIVGMINFAHGEIFMIGAFLAFIAFLVLVTIGVTAIPLILVLVLLFAMVANAVWGWALERVAYRPLRTSFRLAPLITAIGMSIVLQNFMQLAQGTRSKPLDPLLQKLGTDAWGIGILTERYSIMQGGTFTVTLSAIQILIIAVTIVVLMVFSYIIARTPLGRAQRACEQDRTMASLLGVNVDQVIALTFVMGASLASVAALMYFLYYTAIDPFIGFVVGIKAFTAAVLGGIGSIPGAVLGGLAIGFIEMFWAGYFSADYKNVATFSILAIVLIFRPSGLLGRPEIEKV